MRGNARALVPALVVLGLVGVVAVAATGRTSTGTDESRPPAAWVLDTFLSFVIVLVIPAGALLVYGLMQRKDIQRQAAAMPHRRRNLITYLVLMALFAGVTYYRLRNWERTPFEDGISDAFSNGETGPTEPTPTGGTIYEPEFTWIPLLVIGALVVIGVAVAMLVARRRQPLSYEEIIARELAIAFDDSLDALRAEPDPRKAVIAAYARLERVLAAHKLERLEAETPNEYLARILEDLDVDRRSVRRLTDLFTEAKFSSHAVDAAMKDDAIEALTTVRDELRARREAAQAAPAPSLALEADTGGAKP
jgi:Domain of unknown function (DUF4129)